MDAQTRNDFADIIRQAQSAFSEVEYTIDTTPERAILRLQGLYGTYRIFITELIDAQRRKYRYYVIEGERVEVGFDNSPDPRALRLKYGRIGTEHAGECIPHRHDQNKTRLELTGEMDVAQFITWIHANLS